MKLPEKWGSCGGTNNMLFNKVLSESGRCVFIFIKKWKKFFTCIPVLLVIAEEISVTVIIFTINTYLCILEFLGLEY